MDTVSLLQMGDWMGAGWWVGVVGMVVWALLLAGVVYAVVRVVIIPVVEESEGAAVRVETRDDAIGVLRERFARGEIDEEEFDRRAAILRGE